MKITLDEVCDFINGGAWSEDEYSSSGIPVLRVSNLQKDSIDFANIAFIPIGSLSKYSRNKLFENDLVIATVGSHPGLINSAAGRAVIIPKAAEGYLLNQNAVCIRASNHQLLDQHYLAYFGKTHSFQHYIQQRGKGAANQMRIAIEAIKAFEIELPPLQIQRRITEVLGRYDALIENYRRQIGILKASAQSLYREWFVRGRCPFARYEDDAKLPVGWKNVKVGDILDLKYGKSLIEESRKPGDYPVVGSSGIVDYHDEFVVDKCGIVVGRKGNVGSVFWIDKPFFPIDTAFYVESKLSLYYLFFNLKTQNFISGDAAVPGLNREQALSNEMIKPADEVLAQFDKLIEPLFSKIGNLQSQIALLQQMRDKLLPRLMSGQIPLTATG